MKRFLIFISILLIATIATVLGVKQYKGWRQNRLVERAKASITKGEFRDASLFARQAVGSDPDSVAAIQVLADLAELGRSTNALFWRKRLVELSPSDPQNRLHLARTALMFGQPQIALEALDSATPEVKQNSDYLKIRGNLFWSLGNAAEAEFNFREAARLDPTNQTVQMNLNLVRLLSTNSNIATEARASLLRLAEEPSARLDVLRQLCTDAVRRTNLTEALKYSQDLVRDEVPLADQLRHLALLFDGRTAEFPSYLQFIQGRCSTNANQAAVLTRWMKDSRLTNECSVWITSLPASVREQVPIAQAEAEILLERQDWDALEQLLAARAWGTQEYLRQLLSARVDHAQGNTTGKRSHWLKSLKEASGQLDRLVHLARVTETWTWRDEMDDALNAIVIEFPAEKWAEKYLSASLHLAGKTQALQNLLARTVEREPTNNIAKSNLATTGMLLAPSETRWHKIAHEAFQSAPSDPFVASTHALSLHLQGRTAEGVAALSNLPPSRLEEPSIAVWYGFLLAHAGQKEQAAKYIKLGEKARLLPEETRLLATATK